MMTTCTHCGIEFTRAKGQRSLCSLACRFWSKVDKSGECWLWTASSYPYGYGMMNIGDRKYDAAHRVSWRLVHGDPGEMWVLHKCDNPRCVRPSHLFLGDRRANIDDMLAKERQNRGAENVNARLDEEKVRQMRELREGGLSYDKIGARFGVSGKAARCVCERITWKHVA
jgi:hypothetical protein